MKSPKTQLLLPKPVTVKTVKSPAPTSVLEYDQTTFTGRIYLKALLVSVIAFVLFLSNIQAQRYVNKEYSTINGLPVDLNWSSSILASTGHLVTVGNTYTSGQEANVLLTKIDGNGNVIWQVEYDSPDHLEDYGIGIIEDASGNFLVTATSYRNASASLDILVLMFNSSGQLQWEYSYNGTGNGDDIPSMAMMLPNGDIALCGATENTGTGVDAITIKLNSSGTQQWASTFDYAGFHDAGVKLRYIPIMDRIRVTGASAGSANVYDVAILSYKSSNGSLLNSFRTNFGIGIDQPTCFGTDNNGKMYIGGWYTSTPGNWKMSLLCISDSLTYEWDTLRDVTNGDDRIFDMVVSGNGDIFVTGYVEKGNGFQAYTARYDNQGNLIWEKTYLSPSGSAKGKRISFGNTGNLLVAGMVSDSTDTNMLVLEYDQSGRLLMSKEHDAGGSEVAATIESDFMGNIYVQGTTTVNGNGYVTVKYSTFMREGVVVNDTIDSVNYVDNEVIVRVHANLVDTPAVNNRGKTFGTLDDFVQPEVVNSLNTLYDGKYHFGRMNAVKMYRRFTTENEISITRTGDTIDVPPFWATFVVIIPDGLNEVEMAEEIESLGSVVKYAEVNLVAEFNDMPNDPSFASGSQNGLESANNPDHDIEMDRAWDFHHGSSSARIGDFDSGINWAHEDFSVDGSGTFGGSTIIGGWDYISGSHISADPANDGYGHGTGTMGVIGARRNNGLGISGIAGGDAAAGNNGCELIAMRIGNSAGTISWSNVAEAVAEGALWDPNANPTGYAMDVMNMSFGNTAVNNDILTLQENVKFAYDNDCVVVASSGNSGDETVQYPATFPEPWVMKVGANDHTGERASFSTHGNGLDLIAPGTDSLLQTLDGDDNDGYSYDPTGTSFAAPIVAGAAGLLMSYVNDHFNPNPLAPDDVEFLLCEYRTDVGTQGYDEENGSGRLNMGLVMENMEWPFFWVEHFEGATTNYTATQIGSNQLVTLFEDMSGLASAPYLADVFRITLTVNHSIGNATLLNSWIRNGAANSNMLANGTTITGWPSAELISANATGATVRGHIYHITSTIGGSTVDEWIPFQNGGQARFAYSLHLNDPEASSIEEVAESTGENVYLYPNPSQGQQWLVLAPSPSLKVSLVDIGGRVLRTIFEGEAKDSKTLSVSIADLPAGMYFYRIEGETYSDVIPFIRQ